MKSTEITPGQKFETFYGNGQYIGITTITRITKHSIFHKTEKFNEQREAITTVQNYIDKKTWKLIN